MEGRNYSHTLESGTASLGTNCATSTKIGINIPAMSMMYRVHSKIVNLRIPPPPIPPPAEIAAATKNMMKDHRSSHENLEPNRFLWKQRYSTDLWEISGCGKRHTGLVITYFIN
jgi:hypothetical protein